MIGTARSSDTVEAMCQKCYTSGVEDLVPTKNRRINMVLDDAMFEAIDELASRRGSSRSTVARELLIDALEMQEDVGLGQIAAEREAGYEPDTAVSHDEVWTLR